MLLLVAKVFKVLLLPLFIFIMYETLTFLKERKIDEKIRSGVEKYNRDYEDRITSIKYSQYYVSKNKKKNYIDGLDLLIEKSNIRYRIPLMTSEVLIILSLILAIILSLVIYLQLFNILAGIVVAIIGYNIPSIGLKVLANKNARKVDNYMTSFVNILENFCYIKDDISYAITNATPYLKEPLKSYAVTYSLTVNYGGDPFEALEDLKDKVDNKRFKFLIKNLQLCLKYKGQFIEVLKESKESMKSYQIERDKRKKAVERTRMTILAMLVVCIVLGVGSVSMNPMLILVLKNTFAGQVIVVYNIAAISFTIYKLLTIEKFDY
ncbi:hypothetical protein D3C81_10050 [compost metagenome]